ncbi:MAG: leucine-rich repeat protein [Clostridiales Family XIII bacterium]|nr:leucine-rich repeat protein [Clostridiales Family XIII bacterium]
MAIPSGVASIGNFAFSDCANLTKARLGSGLTDIGGYAFSGCAKLAEMIFTGASAPTISSYAIPSVAVAYVPKGTAGGYAGKGFSGIVEYEAEELGVKWSFDEDTGTLSVAGFGRMGNYDETNVPWKAYKSSIVSAVISDGVQSISPYAFRGCSNLTSVTMPPSVTDIGDYAFSGCAKLSAIELPANLASVNDYVFYGCASLESIAIPSGVASIGDYAFYGNSNLETVSFEAGYCTITGRYVFANSPKVKFIAPRNSLVTVYALDNGITVEVNPNLPSSLPSVLINRELSAFTRDYSSVNATGTIIFKVNYRLTSLENVSNSKVTIKLSSNLNLATTESPVLVNGNANTDYTFNPSTGVLTVPVVLIKNEILVSVVPTDTEALYAYAAFECTKNGTSVKDIIGVLMEDSPLLTISADDEVNSPTFTVKGIAAAKTNVSIYVGDTLLTATTSSSAGGYSAEITIPNAVDKTTYTIKAVVSVGDIPITASKDVIYDYEAPVLSEFKLFYDKREFDLISLNGLKPVIVFTSNNNPWMFTVNFSNPDAVREVFVCSEKANDKRRIQAFWDVEKEVFIAVGYFDFGNKSYLPGTLTVEYVRPNNIASARILDAELPDDRDVQGDVRFSRRINTELLYAANAQGHSESEDGNIGEFSALSGGATLLAGTLNLQQLKEKFPHGRYWNHVGMVGNNPDGTTDKPCPTTHKNELNESTCNTYVPGRSQQCMGYAEKIAEDYYGEPIARKWQTAENLDSLKAGDIIRYGGRSGAGHSIFVTAVNGENITYTDCNSDNHCVINWDKSISKQTVMSSFGYVLVAPYELSSGGSSEPDPGSSDGSVRESAGFSVNIQWRIDPSGYVYEAVTSNRIEGVKATAWWTEPGEDTAQQWDSTEYEQNNPLHTDYNGRYAWDTPEGLWQVRFEKEGYAPTESEWLPVPPPQTEVNVGMVSLEAPQIAWFNAYDTYAELAFTKYMKPESVNALVLKSAAETGIPYTLDYPNDESALDGMVYAKRFKLVYNDGYMATNGNYTIESGAAVLSYANVGAITESKTAAYTKPLSLILPEAVTVDYGRTIEVEVTVVNYDPTHPVFLEAESDFDLIAEVVSVGGVSADGKAIVRIQGNLPGNASVTIALAGTGVSAVLPVRVEMKGEDVGILVSPREANVPKGGTQAFGATDESQGGKAADVAWSVSGNTSAETTVVSTGEGAGLLTVAADETAATLTVMATSISDPEISDSATVHVTTADTFLLGDVNEDHVINMADATLVYRHHRGKTQLVGDNLLAADVNRDNAVNMADATLVYRYHRGKIDSFPAGGN